MTARIIAIATTLALNLGSVGIAPAALVWTANAEPEIKRDGASRRPAGIRGPRCRIKRLRTDPSANTPSQRDSNYLSQERHHENHTID